MNIYLNLLINYSTYFLKERIQPALTDQHKKIILIASIAFIGLAACLRHLIISITCLEKELEKARKVEESVEALHFQFGATDEQVQQVRIVCPNLKRLDLSSCEQITDAGIENLPFGLKELDLSSCKQLTDEGIKNLPYGLKKLNLASCEQITDAGIKNLPYGLKELDLSSCEQLTDAMLKNLPPQLEVLELLNCDKLTEAGINNFSKTSRFSCKLLTNRAINISQDLEVDCEDMSEFSRKQFNRPFFNQPPFSPHRIEDSDSSYLSLNCEDMSEFGRKQFNQPSFNQPPFLRHRIEDWDSSYLSLISSMDAPQFDRLDFPGHPNWMPNGGNSCYISATLWPLFLLLDSQIQAKIKEFPTIGGQNEVITDQSLKMQQARKAFVSLYQKIAAEKIEEINVDDVNTFRKEMQRAYPEQFAPNTFLPEDAYDFLVWVVDDLLELHETTKNSPKFSVLHTFCSTSDKLLPNDDLYDYKTAIEPSYSSEPSHILNLRLDDEKIHKTSLKELITTSRKTEIIERNAYKKNSVDDGPKYQSFPTHHYEFMLVESKESAPEFFVGRLTRFTLSDKGKKKRFDEIRPNATLEFKIKGKEEDEDTVPYDLVAITVHEGPMINNGHYFSYFRIEDKFFKYDDIKGPSTCIDDKKVMQDATENGYLFYYRKRESGASPPSPLPNEEFLDLAE